MKKINKSRLIAIHNNKFLVLKKNKPELRYSTVGGVVRKTETAKEGLIREIAEEAHAKVSRKDVEFLFSFTFRKQSGIVKNKYYLLKNTQKYNFKLKEKNKFDDLVWVNIIELLNDINRKEKHLIKAFIVNSSLFDLEEKKLFIV